MEISGTVLENIVKQTVDDDSFVDCLQLKTASLSKLASGNYKGKMEKEDTDLIIGTLKTSPREKVARLKKYGIIK